MEKIKATMEECHVRWDSIEQICGFQITGYETDRISLPKKSIDRKISAFKTNDIGHYVRGRTPYEDYANALNYQRAAISSKYASSSEVSSSSDDAEI
jgi:hypothetical protein